MSKLNFAVYARLEEGIVVTVSFLKLGLFYKRQLKKAEYFSNIWATYEEMTAESIVQKF